MEAQVLTQYGMMAERHWREFLPKMVAELTEKGTLKEALYEAQETTLDEQEELYQQFRKQGLTEDQSHRQAWEIVQSRYILLPAETEAVS